MHEVLMEEGGVIVFVLYVTRAREKLKLSLDMSQNERVLRQLDEKVTQNVVSLREVCLVILYVFISVHAITQNAEFLVQHSHLDNPNLFLL